MDAVSPHQRTGGLRHLASPQVLTSPYYVPAIPFSLQSRISRLPNTFPDEQFNPLLSGASYEDRRWGQNEPWNPVVEDARLADGHLGRSRNANLNRTYAASDSQLRHPDTDSIASGRSSRYAYTTGTAPTDISLQESTVKRTAPLLQPLRLAHNLPVPPKSPAPSPSIGGYIPKSPALSVHSDPDQNNAGYHQPFVQSAQVNAYSAGAPLPMIYVNPLGEDEGASSHPEYREITYTGKGKYDAIQDGRPVERHFAPSPGAFYQNHDSIYDDAGRVPPETMEVQAGITFTKSNYDATQDEGPSTRRFPPSPGAFQNHDSMYDHSAFAANAFAASAAPRPKRGKSSWRTGRRTGAAGAKDRGRPFHCVFYFAGCTKDFATKDEWKRHVSSQHFRDKVWTCNMGTCGEESKKIRSTFNQKDLFGQHLKRMHGPDSQHKTAADVPRGRQPFNDNQMSPEMQEFVSKEVPKIQDRCKRQPPDGSLCGFCNREFYGPNSWEERMEHVGRHYENATPTSDDVNPERWSPDQGLIDWAVKEGIVTRQIGGTYQLGKVGKEAAMGDC